MCLFNQKVPENSNVKLSLSIRSMNINGLGDKLNDPNFVHLLNNFDLFWLQETWLNLCDSSQQLKEIGYIDVNTCRDKKQGGRRISGGISIF